MRRGPKAMRLISYRCHFTRSPGIQRSSSCIYAQLSSSRLIILLFSQQLEINDERFEDAEEMEGDNNSGHP
ncbi:hypothetical protein RHGRI_008380 [Rhododendron griersonianum]|uniref:Uncharacterized protein n=1 Tax=Rhododendron griersonianum TaxID=479676 RepID=A0AAV6L1A7_9ERIC|nr:hypothetical protein RHGRI_008380 [Rhododendron griersonianum]